jgi:hypothetical protein
MAKEISLTALMNTISEVADRPILLLDEQGNSETFFKYRSCSLLYAAIPSDMTPEKLRRSFKHCVRTGDFLVFVIEDESPYTFFDPECFPVEVMEYANLTMEFLSRYDDENVTNIDHTTFKYIKVHDEFRVVFLVKSADPPAWADDQVQIVKIV